MAVPSIVSRPDFGVIAAWVKPGAKVLDLGCGDGSLMRFLRETRDIRGYGVEIDDANVLVENFRPGALERLGLAPATLLERNPRLVITRVTGFGQDGPYANRPGFATVA